VMCAPEISAVLSQYRVAILAGDRAALDALLDGDYEFVSAQARVVDRDRRLATLAANPEILADLTFNDVDIRLADSVAIVRASFQAEFAPHTGRTAADRGVSTLVLSRHGEGWRLRHQHNSHSS
jgi:ketosteroid isomerase-like protein